MDKIKLLNVIASGNYGSVIDTKILNKHFVIKAVGGYFEFFDKIIALKEYYIGTQLNKMRKYIPNFVYTFGYFMCDQYSKGDKIERLCNKKISHVEMKDYSLVSAKGEGIDDRKRKERNMPYILIEKLDGFTNLFYFLSKHRLKNMDEILFQVLLSLEMARTKFDFCHLDLHFNNILVKELDEEVDLCYYLPIGTYTIRTKYLAVIIDYGFSYINVNNVPIYFQEDMSNVVIPVYSPFSDLFKVLSRANTFSVFETKQRYEPSYFVIPKNIEADDVKNSYELPKSNYEYSHFNKTISHFFIWLERTYKPFNKIVKKHIFQVPTKIYWNKNDVFLKLFTTPIEKNKNVCRTLINNLLPCIKNTFQSVVLTGQNMFTVIKNISYLEDEWDCWILSEREKKMIANGIQDRLEYLIRNFFLVQQDEKFMTKDIPKFSFIDHVIYKFYVLGNIDRIKFNKLIQFKEYEKVIKSIRKFYSYVNNIETGLNLELPSVYHKHQKEFKPHFDDYVRNYLDYQTVHISLIRDTNKLMNLLNTCLPLLTDEDKDDYTFVKKRLNEINKEFPSYVNQEYLKYVNSLA